MITSCREAHIITRNTSHFKRVKYATSSQDTTLGITAAFARKKSIQQQQPPNQQQQQDPILDVLDQGEISVQKQNETTLENREEIDNEKDPLNNPTLDDPTVVDEIADHERPKRITHPVNRLKIQSHSKSYECINSTYINSTTLPMLPYSFNYTNKLTSSLKTPQ